MKLIIADAIAGAKDPTQKLTPDQWKEYSEVLGKFQIARKLKTAEAIREFPDTIQFQALFKKWGISLSAKPVAKKETPKEAAQRVSTWIRTPAGDKAIIAATKKKISAFKQNVGKELENWGPGYEDTEVGELMDMALDEYRYDLIADIVKAATKFDTSTVNQNDATLIHNQAFAVLKRGKYWQELKKVALKVTAQEAKKSSKRSRDFDNEDD